MLCWPLPIHEGVVPGLAYAHRRHVDLAQHGHDPLLEGGPARGEDCAGLGQLLVHVVVGQQVGRRHLQPAMS